MNSQFHLILLSIVVIVGGYIGYMEIKKMKNKVKELEVSLETSSKEPKNDNNYVNTNTNYTGDMYQNNSIVSNNNQQSQEKYQISDQQLNDGLLDKEFREYKLSEEDYESSNISQDIDAEEKIFSENFKQPYHDDMGEQQYDPLDNPENIDYEMVNNDPEEKLNYIQENNENDVEPFNDDKDDLEQIIDNENYNILDNNLDNSLDMSEEIHDKIDNDDQLDTNEPIVNNLDNIETIYNESTPETNHNELTDNSLNENSQIVIENYISEQTNENLTSKDELIKIYSKYTLDKIKNEFIKLDKEIPKGKKAVLVEELVKYKVYN